MKNRLNKQIARYSKTLDAMKSNKKEFLRSAEKGVWSRANADDYAYELHTINAEICMTSFLRVLKTIAGSKS